ncbi:MAG TPA: hypothetical protein VKQ31_06745 [Steroidobacteraceae bacterium]|nr:hypothetical protein [Steroidobacteraceae bacterium]
MPGRLRALIREADPDVVGNLRRAIDFEALVRAAVALDSSKPKR